MRKKIFLCLLACCALSATYKPLMQRQAAQYLSTDAAAVQDTCPGSDIDQPFTCTKKQEPGYTCFDVYRVQGDPVDTERYTLLDQTVTVENTSPDPLCPMDTPTCESFLVALKYNLDFSWFISNFPSSSFPQCSETYSCTRIACLKPLPPTEDGTPQAQKLSCVFKRNQIFFLGAWVTCQDKSTPSK